MGTEGISITQLIMSRYNEQTDDPRTNNALLMHMAAFSTSRALMEQLWMLDAMNFDLSHDLIAAIINDLFALRPDLQRSHMHIFPEVDKTHDWVGATQGIPLQDMVYTNEVYRSRDPNLKWYYQDFKVRMLSSGDQLELLRDESILDGSVSCHFKGISAGKEHELSAICAEVVLLLELVMQDGQNTTVVVRTDDCCV